MKNILYKAYALIMVLSALVLNSCVEPVDLVTENARDGGMVLAESNSLNYVVGNTGPYAINLTALQGPSKVEQIKLYKSFYNVISKKWSNEVLVAEVDVPASNEVGMSYTFDQLIADLTIDGQPIASGTI